MTGCGISNPRRRAFPDGTMIITGPAGSGIGGYAVTAGMSSILA